MSSSTTFSLSFASSFPSLFLPRTLHSSLTPHSRRSNIHAPQKRRRCSRIAPNSIVPSPRPESVLRSRRNDNTFQDTSISPSSSLPQQQQQRPLSATSYRWKAVNSALLTTYRESGAYGALELLREYDARGEASVHNFNQTISLLVNERHLQDAHALAVECVERGVANVITFRPIITKCCYEGNGAIARSVWKLMKEANIEADMFFFAELMGAFVKDADLDSATDLINFIHGTGRRPHTVLYNTLLKGYARAADCKSAMDLVVELVDADVTLDETTFNTLLNACVRGKNDAYVNKAIQLMESQGIKPGVPTFNTVLKLYSRRGSLNDVIRIFDEMRKIVKPSIVTFNTLIDACGHRGEMEKAAEYFDVMVAQGLEPDIVTMTSLIKGFGRARDPKRAVELFEAIKVGGYEIEERTRYAVIHACFRGNDRANAKRLMEEIMEGGQEVRPKTIIWALEMDVYNDDEQGALETLEMARRSNFKIDYPSKRDLLRECGQRGGFSNLMTQLDRIEES
eukprot:Plantae.Rhodophyta-Hildenbrandia_rubra.ctg2152.p2 GENE.Plantae.Rhodophyta-Hildenbrandia_rubra.ctg2152~~Plantae.Rhodophyta-Hildenbrandia_rubra.ctg2152.p2  ORF type:complete len:512 (-),score=95.84 Plantae.Rhodophyta-Hildenbrandia_rubra.ctg2152:676-2211(-)